MIAVLILPRAFALARDATIVLLEIAPKGLDLEDVRAHLLGVPGVTDVHDLHAWTITSGIPSLSAHVTVTDACLAERGVGATLDELSKCVGRPLRRPPRDVPGRARHPPGARGPRRGPLTPRAQPAGTSRAERTPRAPAVRQASAVSSENHGKTAARPHSVAAQPARIVGTAIALYAST